MTTITDKAPLAISGRYGQVADLAHWRRHLRATAQASPELPAIVWDLNDDWEFLSEQRIETARLQADLDRQYVHELDAVYQSHIPALPVTALPSLPASPEPGTEAGAAPVLDEHTEAALARFNQAHDDQDDTDESSDTTAAA